MWNTDAQSAELDSTTEDPVVIFMPEISKTHMGGTMRLGLRATVFGSDCDWSNLKRLYGNQEVIWERHRHRYEINPEWVHRIEKHGLKFTGKDEKGERMQVAEIRDHPYYVGMQAHPEFCTRPLNPSPGYLGFVAASSGVLEEQLQAQANYLAPHPSRYLKYRTSPAGSGTSTPNPTTATSLPELSANGPTNLRINGLQLH